DYLDNTRGLAPEVLPDAPLRLTAATDRVVDSAAEVTVADESLGRRIVSTPRGTAKTVVWNPWDTLVTGMADVPDTAWPEFVCIEPAIAKDGFVALSPWESHRIGVTYRIEGCPLPALRTSSAPSRAPPVIQLCPTGRDGRLSVWRCTRPRSRPR